ncbi:MAG TPA: hypothetical protein VG756_22210 [Pseudonocardiaceae bacterium]|nr:hypothetical protein [Pseudonocardiaceae bacterium]
MAARRWALVAALAALACVLPTVVASLPTGSAEPGADRLRQLVLDSADQPYVGYARAQAELGLPDLPDLGNLSGLLSGTTDIRVWYRSDQHKRVDVIDTVGERDVYTTPTGEYTWDYGIDLLTRIVGSEPVRLPEAGDLVPPDLARRVLRLDPADPVASLPTRRIAGIDAAGLRLRPTDPATTVGQVDMWVDPANGLPLRVEITPRGAAQPILTSQFLDLSQAAPDSSTLTPPVSGAGGVSTATAPDVLGALNTLGRFPLPRLLAGYPLQPQLAGLPGVGRYGAGLATFVVLPLPGNVGSSAIRTALTAGATQLTMQRGRAVLIGIPMLSVLLEQAGFGRRTYLVAGLVTPAVLRQAATQLATLRGRPVR